MILPDITHIYPLSLIWLKVAQVINSFVLIYKPLFVIAHTDILPPHVPNLVHIQTMSDISVMLLRNQQCYWVCLKTRRSRNISLRLESDLALLANYVYTYKELGSVFSSLSV